jgi:adenylate cyclase
MPDSGTMPASDTQEPADDVLLQLALPRSQKVVLVIDLVESVRLMSTDEAGTVARWHGFVQQAKDHTIPQHHGRLVKSLGDGLMVEFEQARDAVNAAQTLHSAIAHTNAGQTPARHMHLRVGINSSQIYTDQLDIYGAGVNLAARLATLAGPGETVVSASVRDGLTDGLDASVEDLGECYLKHIDEPVRAYRAGVAGAAPVVVAQREYSAPLQPTIAVIPFTARSNAPEHFAIGELIADGVIAQLGLSEQIKVISRLATTALRDRMVSVGEVQAHLQADYVLSGSYAANDGKLLVTTELVDTHSQQLLWVERLNGDVGDLLQVQSAMCHGIASACHESVLGSTVQKAMYRPLPTLSSQALMFTGIAAVHHASREGFDFSERALTTIVERHPRHATAYAWLAKWYAIRANRGVNDPQSRQIASNMADRAIQAEPESPFALAIYGLVRSYFFQDSDSALKCYDEALIRNPNEVLAWLYRGTLLAWQGRGAESAIAASRALQLAPIGPMQYYVESLAAFPLMSAANYEDAITLFSRSIRLNANHLSSHRGLVVAYELSGRGEEARQAAQRLLVLRPTFTVKDFLQTNAGRDDFSASRWAQALAQAGIPRI